METIREDVVIRHTSLGLELRRLRDLRGQTQKRMAAALGVSQPWLSRLEAGREEMTEGCLRDALDFLNVSADDRPAVVAAWEASRLPVHGAAS